MTNTTERPLPTDLATLRAHYLPLEPETGVSRTLDAIKRIDKLIAACREQLSQADEYDHEVVSDLVGAAITGEKLEPIAGRISLGARPALTHRLEQLQTARNLASHRHTQAQHNDEGFLQWRAACDRVTAEWRQATAINGEQDSENARFRRLVDFATTH